MAVRARPHPRMPPPAGSRWDALPCDLQALVLAHRAALAVQRAWLRWSLYGHARRAVWPEVRDTLGHRAWRELALYAGVRREWRGEAASWLAVDAALADVLRCECRQTLWGACTARLPLVP